MKYWFFDGNDVVGPFTPQELAARPEFSVSSSLVCPENFSEDEDSWKTASSFADFGPASAASSSNSVPSVVREAESTEEEAALFDKEMDTFLKNPSILAGTAAPAPDGPPLEIPKKPAKPGPIEDYFNNINGEDLGDILGIPDPNENSDMNLPRALEKEFEHTSPPADKEIDFVESEPDEKEDSSVPAAEPSAEKEDPVSQQPETAVSAPEDRREELPAQPEEPASVKLAEEASSVPISVSKEEEPLIVLPGRVPPDEPQKETPAEPNPEAEKAVPEQENQSVEPAQAAEADAPGPDAPEETFSTCTLPLVQAGEGLASLPTVTEGGVLPARREEGSLPPDFDALLPVQKEESLKPAPTEDQASGLTPARDIPAPDVAADSSQTSVEQADASGSKEVSSEPEELVPAVQNPAETEPSGGQQPETPAAQEDPKEQTVRNILRGELTVSADTEELKEPLKTVPVTPEVNQIKSKLKQTPEITRFLNTQSQIVRRSRNKKADMMLWILAGLLALGAIFMMLRFLNRPAEQPAAIVSAAPAPESAAAEVPAAESSVPAPVRPAVQQPKPVPPPAPPTAADRALAAVQNHRLPGDKGTIASYFDRIYKTQLSQGYTGVWSAEALHKNTYIVKYRLSKTRLEPVVYVFQADAAQGKLTGALNNIALDLVGKI